MFKKIAKNTTILGIGTFTSRILGFLRDILIAKYFGTSSILEAFIVAFRIPNLLRSLFGEGFSDSVATPVFSEYHKDRKRLFEIGNHLISVLAIALLIIAALGIVFSRYLVMIIAPGFIIDSYKFGLATSFTRITFVYILLIGLGTSLNSLLYAIKKFFVPAFSSCFFNISFIIGIIFFRLFFKNFILVICVLGAGVLELLFSYFFLCLEGFRVKIGLKKAVRDKIIFRMLRLFIPRIWSAIVYHLSVIVDTIFSSLSWVVGQGAMAAVYYANRIVQFPLALIALSISRVAIVDLSRFHKDGNLDDFKKLFAFSFQNIIFFIIPISFILLFIPRTIISVLFVRGEFNDYSLVLTSSVLFFYSFGLFFFCGIKLMVNVFYSLKDTATPAKISTVSLIINVLLNAIFMFPLKVGGIALASSIAAAFNFFLLYRALIRRIGAMKWENIYKEIFKLVLVGLILGLTSKGIIDNCYLNKYIEFIIVLMADSVVFLILGFILKIKQFGMLKRWIIGLKRK